MNPVIRYERPLVRGSNFRHMAVVESDGIYRFKLLEDYTYIYALNILPPEIHAVSFRDASGKEWMRMTTRTKIIREGYAWNGNSPKKGVRVLGKDLWFGTPDHHPGTLEASLGHDADFQFAHTEHYPFSFHEVNYHYLVIAKSNNFKLANAFHGALQDFSGDAWHRCRSNNVKSFIV